MKTKTKLTLFGREWHYNIDDHTKIIIAFHWREIGVSARLYRCGQFGWKVMAWTYPETHGYDKYFHNPTSFKGMEEYLIWAEKSARKVK